MLFVEFANVSLNLGFLSAERCCKITGRDYLKCSSFEPKRTAISCNQKLTIFVQPSQTSNFNARS